MHLHIAHRVRLVDVVELNHRTRFGNLHRPDERLITFGYFLDCLHHFFLRLTKSLRSHPIVAANDWSATVSVARALQARTPALQTNSYRPLPPPPGPPVRGAPPNPGAEEV